MSAYTFKHYDLNETSLFRSLKEELGLTAVGISLSRMEPGMGYPYFHAHKEQEEIFICLQGTGTMLVGNEEITMKPGDFLRVSPDVPRAVGNRTKKPCTFLLLGALPSHKYRNEQSVFVIDDAIEMQDKSPDWSVH